MTTKTFVGFSSRVLDKQSSGSRVVPVHTKGQKDINISIVGSCVQHQDFKHGNLYLTTNFQKVKHGCPVYVIVKRVHGVTKQLFVGATDTPTSPSNVTDANFTQIVSKIQGSDDMADQSDVCIPVEVSTEMCSAIVYPLENTIDTSEAFFVGYKSDSCGPNISDPIYSTLLRVYMV
jgi:hypothetical protein